MVRIHELLKTLHDDVKGKIVENHIILDIEGERAHYWSPQLNFRIEKDDDNEDHTIMAGLIGPRPAVWTLFMFVYFSIGIAGFVISTFGVSRLLIGEYSNLLWAFPVAILFMLTAYSVGKYGERLASDQIEMLKQFIRDAVYYGEDKTQK